MRLATVVLLGCLWMVCCGCGSNAGVEKPENPDPPPAAPPQEQDSGQQGQQMTLD
jgi:hypothetical protein